MKIKDFFRYQLRWRVVATGIFVIGLTWLFIHYGASTDKVRLTADAPSASSKTLYDGNNALDVRATPAMGTLQIDFVRASGKSNKPLLSGEVLQSSQLLNSLIRITPQVKGTWRVSATNNALFFEPETAWLPAKKYEVEVSPKLFNAGIKLAGKKVSFTTDPNRAHIDEFFVFPATQKKHMALKGRVHFDYAVEPQVAEGVSLTLDGKKLTPQISFDQSGQALDISYDNIALIDKDQQAVLQIKWGKMADKAITTLKDVHTFFNLTDAAIITPTRIGQPYTLAAEFTDLVSAQKLLADKKIKAWLLPYEEGYNWKENSVDEVRAELKRATEIDLKPIAGVSPTASYQLLTDLQTRDKKRYVLVEFLSGLTSEGDFALRDGKAFILPVEKYPKKLKIVGSGSVLSPKTAPVLQFVSQGINKAQVRVARIRRGDINHLVSQMKGDIKNPCFEYTYRNYDDEDEPGTPDEEYTCGGYSDFDEYDMAEVFTKTFPLADTGTEPNFFTLNLSNYLKAGSSGLFIVKASDEEESDALSRRLILVSDIGLLYKQEEKGLKVFALGISSQRPLDNAKAELLARNGTVLKTAYTNAQGVAGFEIPAETTPDKKPVAIVVSKGDDYSFIPLGNGYREVSYGRFNVDGKSSVEQQNGLDVLLFTDRGIYRPGEEINFALVAKNKRWESTAGLPLQVHIENPRGQIVMDKKVSLPATGLRDFKFTTETSYPTGLYKISAYREDGQFIADTSFEVKEFEEDKLKVTASVQSPERKGWQPLGGLSAKAQVENLFGAPAVGNAVNMSVKLYPSAFTFAQYPEYTFADVAARASVAETEELSFDNLLTSETGEVVQPLDLSSYDKGTYKLVLRAEAFELESGHSVIRQANLLVSSEPYILGYKTKADLSYLRQNTAQSVDFIAVDADLNQTEPDDLTLHLFSRQYVSVPVRSYRSYRYQSVLEETPLASEPLHLKKGGTSYTLPTKTPGMYAVEIHNGVGKKVMRLEFTVAGNANVSYNMERNAELRLNLEKDTLSPGETLQFNITAPYAGIGLITIEKDKVYAYKWFKADTNSSVQSITLPPDLVGSAYLNVSFLRALDSKDILLTPHSYAVKPFYVIPKQHMAQIELNAPAMVKPGDTLEISYAVSTPSQIIIYGASEGILQVARYKLPNPLAYFFAKQRLGVRTFQMWDLVRADVNTLKEVYGIGGDQDYAAALAALGLNPFARKTEKPVAFWSGILEASAKPQTSTYQVPDYFNGKIRVMAVAVSEKTVASAQRETLVRAPLVLSAGGPVAVAPNDVFEASVKVSNQYEQTSNGEVSVQIKTSPNLQVVGDNRQTLNVPYNQEGIATFKVKVLDGLGEGEIGFEAMLAKDGIKAKRTLSLSVRPAGAYRVSIDAGKGKGKFEIKQFEKRNLYVPFSKRQIAVSSSPLVAAIGLGSYLEKFPHGCTEQIVSQTFPTLVFYAAKGDKTSALESFGKAHKMLQMRQQPSGGFSLWDNEHETSKYASLYAFHMLSEAAQMGYPVSEDLKNRALAWVKRAAQDGSYSDTRFNAYAHYLAARNGVLLTGDLYNLEEYLNKNVPNWKNSITGVYLAATHKLLQNDEKALQIIRAYKSESNYKFYNDYDSSFARNATYLYIVGMHFPQLSEEENTRKLLDNLLENIQAKRYNTMTSALSMLALYAYAQNAPLTEQNITVCADGVPLTLTAQENAVLTADFAGGVKTFEMESRTGAPVYYVITQQGYDSGKVGPSSNGLEVSRLYQVPEPTGKLGEEIEVKITARAVKNAVQNAVITDLLPGGMSIVPNSFKSSGQVDYYNEREDRLLIYGPIGTQSTTYSYKVKLTAAGTFRVPAVTAAGLYDTDLSATDTETSFTVTPRE